MESMPLELRQPGRDGSDAPDFRIQVEEMIDAGNDVLMVTRHHGRGRASGAAVQAAGHLLVEEAGGATGWIESEPSVLMAAATESPLEELRPLAG